VEKKEDGFGVEVEEAEGDGGELMEGDKEEEGRGEAPVEAVIRTEDGRSRETEGEGDGQGGVMDTANVDGKGNVDDDDDDDEWFVP